MLRRSEKKARSLTLAGALDPVSDTHSLIVGVFLKGSFALALVCVVLQVRHEE